MMLKLVLVMTVALVKAQDEDGPDGPSGPLGPPPPRGPFGHEGPGGEPGPPPPGGPFGHNGPRGPGGKHGPPPISILELFPACSNMGQAMQETHKEMMRNRETGRKSCRESEDFRACWRRGVEAVRCAITETPSKDCVDQVTAFIKGDICNSVTTENPLLKNFTTTSTTT